MTKQHEILRMYRKKETLPVCILSWERYKAGQQDYLCIRIEGLWHEFKPPTSRKEIEKYKHFSHTYSFEAMEYYDLLNGTKYTPKLLDKDNQDLLDKVI